jgi:hypothetical protein
LLLGERQEWQMEMGVLCEGMEEEEELIRD